MRIRSYPAINTHSPIGNTVLLITVLILLFPSRAIFAQQTTNLHLAAQRGDVAAVRSEIEAGADVNARQELSITPLHNAVWNGHTEVVRILVTAGANIAIRTKFNRATSLHYSAMRGKVEILELLIKAGADINSRTYPERNTPLHWAVMAGNMDIIQALVIAGANINARDYSGNTAISMALEKEYNEIVSWLLINGAIE